MATASDGYRRRFRRADDPEIASPDLYLSRLHLGVPHFCRTCSNIALDQDYCLETELPRALDLGQQVEPLFP